MSPHDSTLWYFSAGFILVMSLVLVVPILRRKTDVFTTWNMFLLGAIIFNGFSGFNASAPGHYLPTYTTKDYNMYYLGVLIYYPVAIFTYYYWKYPRRLAGRRLLKWPKLSGWSLVILTLILMTIGLFSRFHLPIPVLGQLLFQFGVVTPILALSCAFIAWYRSPSNIMLMILLVALGASTFVIVLGLGGTRRYLMSTLAVAPFALYWVWLRYKSTQQIIIWIVAALFIGVPVLKAFGSIRHTITGAGGLERSMQVIARLPTEIARGGSMEGFMGQDSVECALLTIHMLNDKSDRLAVSPFHATVFVITNPVPQVVETHATLMLAAALFG